MAKSAALRTIFVLVAASLAQQSAFAQTTSAQVTGVVSDPSGAPVPAAAVRITNVDTAEQRSSTTIETGNYTFVSLVPGRYRLDVEKGGFRTVSRLGITLNVNQAARIDFTLEIGQVSDSISVTAEAPLLETTSPAMGQVIDNQRVQGLPLNGRNPLALLALTPGANTGALFGTAPGEQNFIGQGNFKLNGGRDLTNEVLIDGVPTDASSYGQPGFIPSLDAVREFKVQTFPLSAEYGRTGGGVVNISTPGGTNHFHGSLFYFHRNDAVAARNFFSRTSPPKLIRNQQGGTFGGPLARNRTFFFGQFEAFRQRYGTPAFQSLPTAGQREGDFSSFRDAQGRFLRLYDPQTTRPDGAGGFVRDAFANNVIPRSRIPDNARKILSFVPLPNLPGVNGSNTDNYGSSNSGLVDQDQFTIRIDHSLSDRQKVFGRYSHSSVNDQFPNLLGTIADNSRGRYPEARNAVFNYDLIASANFLVNLRAGFSRQNSTRRSPGAFQDGPAKIGFPSSIPPDLFPQISWEFSQIGSPNDNGSEIGNTYSLQGSVSRIRARHSMKWGGDFRVVQFNWYRPGLVSGALQFSRALTQGPNPLRNSPTDGHGFATFLLGMPTRSEITAMPGMAYQQKYQAGYFQDDIQLLPKLTLNIGMRYDLHTPMTERFNQVANFDRGALNPVTNTPGALLFPTTNGMPRTARNWDLNNWGPRIGFAWNALRRTVFRGGYGIFFVQPAWSGGSYDRTASTGFYAQQILTILDPVTPLPWGLANPFPDGPPPVPGVNQREASALGGTVLFVERGDRSPYLQSWNFSVQNEPVPGLLIDAAYAGTKGTHLQGALSAQENQLREQDLRLGDALFQRVANPFAGKIAGSLGAPTITRGQLLRPYPQYLSVGANLRQYGSSSYHSLQLKVERRFARGFTILGAYTLAKLIEDAEPFHTWQNPDSSNIQNTYRNDLEKSISSLDNTHNFVVNYLYELPFGNGKAWLGGVKGLAGQFVSGWSIAGITALRSGYPFSIGNTPAQDNSLGGSQRPNRVPGVSPNPTAAQLRNRIFINGAAFSAPAPFTFGNVSRTEPHTRLPGLQNWDFTVTKDTRIRERIVWQIRAEAFNGLNTVNFSSRGPGPDRFFGSATFGLARNAEPARILQFASRITF